MENTPFVDQSQRASTQIAFQDRAIVYRTEQAYLHWVKRYIYFHQKQHPATLGAPEVTAFLTHLARERSVAASTQNQALSALLFLYGQVLGVKLPWMDDMVRAKRPVQVPVVLTREEVAALLGLLQGSKWLMASLLYGAGLQLMECLRLRVKDIDFGFGQWVVRDGKGAKDRVTMLSQSLIAGIAGARGCLHHHDLYACDEQRRSRCSQPARCALNCVACAKSNQFFPIGIQ
jgi:site-specific recombinase XerD